MVGGPYQQQEGYAPPPPSTGQPQEPREKPLYLCSPFIEAKLVKGNFKTIVQQPKYVDLTEWVAVNSMLYLVLHDNLS